MSRKLNVDSQVSLTLSLHQVYLTEENLKLFFYPILRGLAESNHKLQHSFSKYQFAIILEIKVTPKRRVAKGLS